MIRNALILAAIIAACVGYMLYTDYRQVGQTEETDLEYSSLKMQTAPAFSFRDLAGKEHALADFKDKVVILNFWASWCAPCVIEFPQMVELAKATKNESILIFMSVDDDKESIDRFLKKHGKKLPQENIIIGWDRDKEISQSLFQTYKLPETFIMMPGGIISEKIIGADVEWNGAAMQKKIKSLALTP